MNIQIVREKLIDNEKAVFKQISKMEPYKFVRMYDGIFLIWCAGKLDDDPLVDFLCRASFHLAKANCKRTEKTNQIHSFLYLIA